MSDLIRSFLAFEVVNEEILRRIIRIQRRLAEIGADLKLVKPQSIHITVRFLGNITPLMIEKIFKEMKEVKFRQFIVHIDGLGAFPNLNYPRVIWAGISEGQEELTRIFNQIESSLHGLGFKPERKGFNPHITIVRVRTGRKKAELAEFVLEEKNYSFGIMKVGSLRLKRSELTPSGPIYSTLRKVNYMEEDDEG